ncbi:Phosphatidylinositol transfer protein SEC14 [Handroanthus impetiginosus]|uniref:Phosphatidylinositol transfer protein SEC14 n=1 Tax=Handroanthus impetiginosus TaxID=429701 RepID=A0A2G9GLI8_9LAMI|nr:Phosphatidylinositol transfer protein SEC14 [Handroanthus impetiginosus]
MAEEVEKKMPQEQVEEEKAGVILVVSDVPEAEEENNQEKDEKEPLLVPEAENGQESVKKAEDYRSLQDEGNGTKIADLSENEKKGLQELKQLIQEALDKHELIASASGKEEKMPVAKEVAEKEKDSIPVQTTAKTLMEDDGAKTVEAIEETIIACVQEKPQETEQVFIWGVKLLEDEKSDVILLKFLRARDFKVKDAFTMLKNTLKWRKEFGIDELIEQDLGNELEKVVFMHGYSKEGNPVCYNVYGEFQNKDLYEKMFSDEEKRQKFLRWRIQFLEKSIRKLDFSPGGISTIVQINDLKNSPGPNRWELRQATNQALQLFQDNYPEFVAKQIFINVPWWYLALNKMISPFLTQRTKSKFVVAGPSRSTETLLKYISAEQIPAQYGGLSKEGDFGVADGVTEIIVKPSAKHIVEFPVSEACVASWETRVVGWEVSHGAEFVPSAENGYTIIIQKMKRIGANEEQVISSSYKVSEPGKLVITINNPTSRKKKLLYRFKTKLSVN